jgi:hypothetical protein
MLAHAVARSRCSTPAWPSRRERSSPTSGDRDARCRCHDVTPPFSEPREVTASDTSSTLCIATRVARRRHFRYLTDLATQPDHVSPCDAMVTAIDAALTFTASRKLLTHEQVASLLDMLRLASLLPEEPGQARDAVEERFSFGQPFTSPTTSRDSPGERSSCKRVAAEGSRPGHGRDPQGGAARRHHGEPRSPPWHRARRGRPHGVVRSTPAAAGAAARPARRCSRRRGRRGCRLGRNRSPGSCSAAHRRIATRRATASPC